MKKIFLTTLLLLPLTSFASDLYIAHLSSDKGDNISLKNIKNDGSPVSISSKYPALYQCGQGNDKWIVNDNYDTSTYFDNTLKTYNDKNIYKFTIKYNNIDCENLTLHKNVFSKELTFNKDSTYIGVYQVGNRNFKLVLEKQ